MIISEYLKLANSFAVSPSGNNKNNYANVDEIVKHAVEKKVDAVWAGWGHASENPELPKRLAEKNIVFIGPPSSAMFSLGDKIASTIIAQVGFNTVIIVNCRYSDRWNSNDCLVWIGHPNGKHRSLKRRFR